MVVHDQEDLRFDPQLRVAARFGQQAGTQPGAGKDRAGGKHPMHLDRVPCTGTDQGEVVDSTYVVEHVDAHVRVENTVDRV